MEYLHASNLEFLIRNKISLFCSSIVFVAFSSFLLLRAGFHEKFYSHLFLSAGFSFFFLFIPLMLSAARKNKSLFTSEIFILLMLIYLAPFLNFIPGIRYAICTFGFVSFAICLFIYLSNAKASLKLAILSILAFGFAVWTAFTVWGVARPTLFESLSVSRNVLQAQDLFFHTAITQMIKNYGIPSTGLQGTPYIYYHSGSHWYFAQMSHLMNMPAIWIYTIFYPIVIVPIFFKTFLTFILELQKTLTIPPRSSVMSLALLFCIFLGIPPHLYSKGFLHTSVLILESMTLSMFLMFSLLSLWLIFASSGKSLRELTLPDKVFVLLLTPLLLWCLGFVKISTLFVLLGLFFFLVIRLQLIRTPIAVSFAITGLGSLLIYYATVETLPFGIRQMGSEGNVSWGSFYRAMKAAGLFKAFDWYFLFFLWTYLVIGAWLYIKRYPNSVVPIHEGRFSTVAQALGVVAIVGLTPSVVFSFNNANAIFFVSIQMFLSGATLIALAPSVEAFIMKRKSLSSFYVLGLIVIGVAGYFRIKSATKEILLENLNTRILLSHTPQKPHKRFSLNKDIHTLLSGFQHLDDEVKEQPLYNTFEKLQKLDTATNRSGTLLLVQDYMDGNIIEGTQDLNCLEKSFLVPAIAGYAMVNGALYNCSIDTYGAIYYTYPGKDVDLSPKKVCEQFGSSFHKILSYNVGRDSLVSFNCGNKSH